MNQTPSFNPEMLVLARQSRGYGQADLAALIPISSGLLSMIESGIREIPPDKLQKIGEILDYPMSFFYKNSRLCGPGINEMFKRSRSKVPVRARDKNQALCEINRLNIEALLRGVDIGDIEIPRFDLDEFDGNVQDIARAVRAKWQLPCGPIRNVVKEIEQARGIITQVQFESKLVDATSCWPSNMPPLFFVGIDFPADRIRFSLCHELGHMVMHQDSPNPFQEQQADEFAAEFLMPEKEIKPYLINLNIPKLATLKPYWKVSMSALLMRARDVGSITPRHAKTLWVEMGKMGYRQREPVELDLPPEKPKLLEEILGVYCNQMGYTLKNLAKLFNLYERELCHLYFGFSTINSTQEVQSAIEEAERILDEYRKK
jgi:Zn-dependent peptidase ImmA (M78 family)